MIELSLRMPFTWNFLKTFNNFFSLFSSPDEAKSIGQMMLGHRLFTKQTGREGKPCNIVMACERIYTRREFYFALTLERAFQGIIIIIILYS